MEYEQLNLFDEPQEVEKWTTERKEAGVKYAKKDGFGEVFKDDSPTRLVCCAYIKHANFKEYMPLYVRPAVAAVLWYGASVEDAAPLVDGFYYLSKTSNSNNSVCAGMMQDLAEKVEDDQKSVTTAIAEIMADIQPKKSKHRGALTKSLSLQECKKLKNKAPKIENPNAGVQAGALFFLGNSHYKDDRGKNYASTKKLCESGFQVKTVYSVGSQKLSEKTAKRIFNSGFKYFTKRPAGAWTVPDGFTDYDTFNNFQKVNGHPAIGWVKYPKKLTAEEIYNFELIPAYLN